MNNQFLVVKDEEGNLRPMSGIWRNNEAGKIDSDKFLGKNKGISIVICELYDLSIRV